MTLQTPTGTAGLTYYTYTALKDCFFSISQNWSASSNWGSGINIFNDNNGSQGDVILASVKGQYYGTGTTTDDIISSPSQATHPIFLRKGDVIGYKFLNYNGDAGMYPRFRIYTKN